MPGVWGQSVGQSAISLRVSSWLAHLARGILMLTQAAGLARCRVRAVDLVALLAFCIPCPMRFSIEGKGHVLLVSMTAFALLTRGLILDHASFRLKLNIASGLAVALLARLIHCEWFWGCICFFVLGFLPGRSHHLQ